MFNIQDTLEEADKGLVFYLELTKKQTGGSYISNSLNMINIRKNKYLNSRKNRKDMKEGRKHRFEFSAFAVTTLLSCTCMSKN